MKVNQMNFNNSDLENSEISRDGSKKVKHRRAASKSTKKVDKKRTASTSAPRSKVGAPDEEPTKVKRSPKKTRGKPSSSADPQQPVCESEVQNGNGQKDQQKIAKPAAALNIDTCTKQFRELNVRH